LGWKSRGAPYGGHSGTQQSRTDRARPRPQWGIASRRTIALRQRSCPSGNFFLYPRFASGEINGLLFQATLIVMGVATFSLVFASFYYYCSSLGDRIDDAGRATYSRRGDRFWLVGYTLLFLDPSLVLFSIGLLAVGAVFSDWCICSSSFATSRGSRPRGRGQGSNSSRNELLPFCQEGHPRLSCVPSYSFWTSIRSTASLCPSHGTKMPGRACR
jgi:hypothetical protein